MRYVLEHRMQQTAYIRGRRYEGDVDAYGDPVPTEHTDVTRCFLTQSYRTELEGTFIERDRWLAYFPVGTSLDSNDAVEIDGVVYEVRGPPWPATDLVTGQHTHLEATLERSQ